MSAAVESKAGQRHETGHLACAGKSQSIWWVHAGYPPDGCLNNPPIIRPNHSLFPNQLPNNSAYFSLGPVRVALTAAFVLCLAALTVFLPPAIDAYHDRQHRVIVQRLLNVYRTAEPPWRDPSNLPVATAAEHETLRVTRIRYEKDYMVVRVKVADGREGYVFSGDGFRLDPPAR